MHIQIWDTGLGGDSGGSHYHDPCYNLEDNLTNQIDEHYLAPPNYNSIIDQYSVPQQHGTINNFTPYPVAAGNRHSVPPHSIIHESIPLQMKCTEYYSVPHTDNSIPQTTNTEDQYSISHHEPTPFQSKADECYSVPHIAEDQYSIPRHSMTGPHQMESDELYSVPRTDNSTYQPITEDQCSIPRNSEPIPHQSKIDEFYSVPHSIKDQHSVPTHGTTNESIIHQIEPDEHYSAPHTPKPPKVKDRYGPRQRMRSNTNPPRFASDDMYVAPNINSKKTPLVRQTTFDQSTMSDIRITKDDDDYAVPTPCDRKNGVRSSYTYIHMYICSIMITK